MNHGDTARAILAALAASTGTPDIRMVEEDGTPTAEVWPGADTFMRPEREP